MSDLEFRSDMAVDMVDHMGNDRSIVRAARVSTVGDRSFYAPGEAKTMGLINYLMKSAHGSPFEHNSMTFLVSAPLFVAREFMRHRIGWSYNEESGRYKELDSVFYVPGPDRRLVQVGKPGAYTFEPGTQDQGYVVDGQIRAASKNAYMRYQIMLNEGIAREVARMVLPLNLFTTFYATCNARSLMAFLSLRTEDDRAVTPSHPQVEIQWVARGMEEIFSGLFPATYAAYNKNGRVAP